MAVRAWITPRQPSNGGAPDSGEHHLDPSVVILEQLRDLLLVETDGDHLAELETQGYRVKVLPAPNLMTVGSYTIDITGPPDVPPALEVPDALASSWPHHLVQLVGPPVDEWIQAIELRGVKVVEPISTYGLFVVGTPALVEDLHQLSFVEWTGAFKPAYRIGAALLEHTGRIQFVNILLHPPEAAELVKQALHVLDARLECESPRVDPASRFARLAIEIDAGRLAEVAALPEVRSLDFASATPGLEGEWGTQIVAGNLDGRPPTTAPIPGYQPWLAKLGLSGKGSIVAICDSGVDTNATNDIDGHPDLRGRQVKFVDYAGGKFHGDPTGHGTHIAGIAVGNACTGLTEGSGLSSFLLGQGVAPGAGYVTQNATLGDWPPANFGDLTRDARQYGAQIMNNSWTDNGPVGSGYTPNARRFDQLVRDDTNVDATTTELVIVFSAGNNGPGVGTIAPPKEAKNPIVVGNSRGYRPDGVTGSQDDIRGIADTSSRGPARDGRLLPHVVAPGINVPSARSSRLLDNDICGIQEKYSYDSGTSMAAPHVAGACALLIEWWRGRNGGKYPSPAMLKALLINGAEDLAGGPDGAGGGLVGHIPDNSQGWGRVNLRNILLQAPESDRGPRIFLDQSVAFTTTGQEHLTRVAVVDPTRWMRTTLVWTDAPGAANADPALVNDLDLEVTELETGRIFKGNVFDNGYSVTGGVFDHRNNVECVYLKQPTGTYEVRVLAGSLGGNALPPFNNTPWQDFALVIDNAEVATPTAR